MLSITAASLGDLYTGSDASSPQDFFEFGGYTFFRATNATSGSELWRTDGTAGGTQLFKDLNPGAASSQPGDFVKFSDTKFFFTAADATNGAELWVSDGTVAGTQLFVDINPGAAGSYPTELTMSGGKLYFSAQTAASGVELWVSDGTTGGTRLVGEINAGAASSSPAWLVDVGGTLFFTATSSAYGKELWKSNGTSGTTTMVKDIYPGSVGSNPGTLTALGSLVIFVASDNSYGQEVWRSDGTSAGTYLLKDIRSGADGSSTYGMVECNGAVYFDADDGALFGQGSYGTELWKTDGTTSGTVLVKDINPGVADSFPVGMTNANGVLYFQAEDEEHGVELWKSDGTAAGTVLVKDIYPGTEWSDPLDFAPLGGYLLFAARDASGGRELWRTAGTATTTVRVMDINPGTGSSNPSLLTASNGKVFFSASNGTAGAEPWVAAFTGTNSPPSKPSLAPTTVAEGAAAGTAIAAISATDADYTADPTSEILTYTLVSGEGSYNNDAFTISGDQLITKSGIDYETLSAYWVRIRVTDLAGAYNEEAFRILVTDVNEPPYGLALSGTQTFAENVAVGTLVGTLSATDPESLAVTFELPTGFGDNWMFEIVGNQLKTKVLFDYEARPTYTIRVAAKDPAGNTATRDFTITLTNVNEAPTNIVLSNAAVAEHKPAGTYVGDFSTIDPDAGNTFTYSLVSGTGSADNSQFLINGTQLKTQAVFDYATRTSYSIRVRTVDQGGLSFEKVFTVTVTRDNHAPTDITLSANTTPEMQPKQTLIGYLSTNDPDTWDTITYTLVPEYGNPSNTYDNWLFTITGNQLRNAELLDYESRSLYTIRVRATDLAGEWWEKVFQIQVTDLPDGGPVTIGLFDPSLSYFYLRNSNTTGGSDISFGYGAPNAGWQVFVGDWNGDGHAGVGLFDPHTSTFYLTNNYTNGYAEYTFGYGAPNGGWTPIVGDWDGNGTDGVGLYDPHTSTFYLTNTLQSGFAEYTFGYGVPNGGWKPIVGDWNGDRAFGVGLYDPSASQFYLVNALASGFADHTFGYGLPNGGWTPIVGDWNGDGRAGVGLFAPESSSFYLTNRFVSGTAEYTFGYGAPYGGWKPLVGDWDGSGDDGVGLYSPADSVFYLTNSLLGGTAEYTAAFGGPGCQPIVGHWQTPNKAAALSASAVDQVDLAALAAAELDPSASLGGLADPLAPLV